MSSQCGENKQMDNASDPSESSVTLHLKEKDETVKTFDFLESSMKSLTETSNESDDTDILKCGKGFTPKADQVLIKTTRGTHPLTAELQEYYVRLTEGIFGFNEHIQKKCFKTIKKDPNMVELLPYLAIFIKETVEKNIVLEEPTFLLNAMKMVRSLYNNEFVKLERELHHILPAVLSCILTRKMCRSYIDEHWILRDFSALVMAGICEKYNSDIGNITNRVTQIYLKPLSDPHNYPLTTIYGAVKGMTGLGSKAVKEFLLPNITIIAPVIMNAEQNKEHISDRKHKKLLKESKFVKNSIAKAVVPILFQEKEKQRVGIYVEKFGHLGKYLHSQLKKFEEQYKKNQAERSKSQADKIAKFKTVKSDKSEAAASSSTKPPEVTSEETKVATISQTSSTPVTVIASTTCDSSFTTAGSSKRKRDNNDPITSSSSSTADGQLNAPLYKISYNYTPDALIQGSIVVEPTVVASSANLNASALNTERQPSSAHNIESYNVANTSGYQISQCSKSVDSSKQVTKLKTYHPAAYYHSKQSKKVSTTTVTTHPIEPIVTGYSDQETITGSSTGSIIVTSRATTAQTSSTPITVIASTACASSFTTTGSSKRKRENDQIASISQTTSDSQFSAPSYKISYKYTPDAFIKGSIVVEPTVVPSSVNQNASAFNTERQAPSAKNIQLYNVPKTSSYQISQCSESSDSSKQVTKLKTYHPAAFYHSKPSINVSRPTVTGLSTGPRVIRLPIVPRVTDYSTEPTVIRLPVVSTVTGRTTRPTVTGWPIRQTITGYPTRAIVTGWPTRPTVGGWPTRTTVTGWPSRATVTGWPTRATVTGYSHKQTITGSSTEPTVIRRPTELRVTGRTTGPTVTGWPTELTVTGRTTGPTVTGCPTVSTVTGSSTRQIVTAISTRPTVTSRSTRPDSTCVRLIVSDYSTQSSNNPVEPSVGDYSAQSAAPAIHGDSNQRTDTDRPIVPNITLTDFLHNINRIDPLISGPGYSTHSWSNDPSTSATNLQRLSDNYFRSAYELYSQTNALESSEDLEESSESVNSESPSKYLNKDPEENKENSDPNEN